MTIRLFQTGLLPPACRRPSLFRRACRSALGAGSGRAGEIILIFVTNRQIRAVNRRFLSHDRATDVIAFPYTLSHGAVPGAVRAGRPAASPGRRAGRSLRRGRAARDMPFADVYVSVDQARKQAAELGHSLLMELLTLAVHGVLHAAGYDDHTAADRRRMFAKQEGIVARLVR